MQENYGIYLQNFINKSIDEKISPFEFGMPCEIVEYDGIKAKVKVLLKDYDNVLRIFVHAPLEDCMKTVEALNICPKRQVKNYIQTIDKRRSSYYHYFTGNDWKDASNYDLCLNTSHLNWEQCIELVKAYLHIKFPDASL